MMWWSHSASGWDWAWMSLMMIVFWSLISVAVYAIIRGVRQGHGDGEKPQEVLAGGSRVGRSRASNTNRTENC